MRPGAPGLPLAGVRSVIADPASELPVLRALSLCVHAAATTPAQRLGLLLRWFTFLLANLFVLNLADAHA
jgi:hypothetical protein